MRGGYTQAGAAVCPIRSKTLVNRRSNKVVNIASTKMMKRIFGLCDFFPRATTGFHHRAGTVIAANGSRECAPDDRLREAIHRDEASWIASSHPPSLEGGLWRTRVLPCANASRLSQAMTGGFF